MIPPSLFLFYLFKSDGIFEDYCSFCFVTSFIMGIGGIICTWLVPDDYNLGQVRAHVRTVPPDVVGKFDALQRRRSIHMPDFVVVCVSHAERAVCWSWTCSK
jgi:hypothetical protein